MKRRRGIMESDSLRKEAALWSGGTAVYTPVLLTRRWQGEQSVAIYKPR